MMHDLLLDRRSLILGAGTLGSALAFPGPAAFARTASPAWPKVQAVLDDYVGPSKLPGVAGAVARGTEAASFMTSGTLAFGSPTRVTPDSLFRIYSMTKPITAMAAMLLIEEGKLGLDQNVADFIPGFANPRVILDPTKDLTARPAARPVTIRGLMTHTAGLGYLINVKGALLAEYIRLGLSGDRVSRLALPGYPKFTPAPSLAAFADRIATLPLIADPGTRWSYSAGLDVLGRVIEIVGGMPFEAFLRTRLFDPLGMRSTFFTVPARDLARLMTNYGIVNGTPLPIDPGATSIYATPPAFPSGGGGLVSSPRDYDRFLQMLAGYGAVGRRRIMKDATARLAMSNLLPPGVDTKGTFVEGQGFGAGGRVTIARTDRLGAGLGTYGWGGAAATIAWVDPTQRIRGLGHAQYMPDTAKPFTGDFGKSVYASL